MKIVFCTTEADDPVFCKWFEQRIRQHYPRISAVTLTSCGESRMDMEGGDWGAIFPGEVHRYQDALMRDWDSGLRW